MWILNFLFFLSEASITIPVHLLFFQSSAKRHSQYIVGNCEDKWTFTFKVCKSVHHQTIQINQPTRCNNFSSLLLAVIYSSKCFGRPHAHHQELNNCSSNLWFNRWSVLVAVLLVVVGATTYFFVLFWSVRTSRFITRILPLFDAYIHGSPTPLVDCVWNVMAHAQKPDFVFRRNGRIHLNRLERKFSRLLAAEACASAVVMLDTRSSEVV